MTSVELEVHNAVLAARMTRAAGHQAGCNCHWDPLEGVCDCCGRRAIVGRPMAKVLDTREANARKRLRQAKREEAREQEV